MSIKKSTVDIKSRFQWGKDIPLKTPFVVYCELSGYCNLRCKFCPYAKHAKTTKKDLMTFDIFEKLINDLKQFPDKLKLFRICGNGENLLNKSIIKMLQHLYDSKITHKTQLITNGTLLNQELIQKLPSLLDMIVISIEGLSNNDYVEFSGTKIDYNQFCNNIRELYKHKKDCVIHLKIHNLAVSTEDKKKIFFDTFQDYCDEIYIENIVPLFPEMDYCSSTESFRFDNNTSIKKRIICPQIFKSVQVQADGDVVPCCVDWNRINLLGNIMKESLYDIWNGPILYNLQQIHLHGNRFNIHPCKNCSMNEYSEIDNIDEKLI